MYRKKNKYIIRNFGNAKGISLNHKIIAFVFAFSFTSAVIANPVVGNIASGNVSIQQTSTTTTVNQSSPQAIINWQSFNIDKQEATHFIQPAGGIALNRINPLQGASQIYGTLTATGQIILVNPAGIYIGPSAYINVGGLIATTANITDQDFLSRNYKFTPVANYSGSIVNEGQIIAADHGLIALVGPTVTNTGLIRANLGHVILASGSAFTINFAGNDLINFSLDAPTTGKGVTNTGSLIADGGQILVTAKAAQGVLDNVINMQGIAQAKSVYKQNGEIIISGDPNGGVVKVASNINASGKDKRQTGGTVNITGYDILLDSPTLIDVSGDIGGGTINVGGNLHGTGVLPNANATVMTPGVSLLADAITNGNGGNVVLWSNGVTKAYGNISAQGGSLGGNGGFIETSSKNYLDVNGLNINTAAPNGNTGTWLLDPTSIYIANNLSNAQANGMTSSDTTADTGTGTDPTLFEASGATPDSLLTVASLESALGSSNVLVTTSNSSGTGTGDINVVDNVTWNNSNSLTLSAYRNINILSGAAITDTSNGSLVLQANNTAAFDAASGSGLVNQSGGINVAGGVTVYSNPSSSSYVPVSITNSGGSVTNYMLVNDANDLSDVSNASSSWNKDFALNTSIDASSLKNFTPIGNSGTNFTGIFNGQNYTISNLSIDQPSTDDVGLFGATNGATLENMYLQNINVIGQNYVGGLTGAMVNGSIDNVGILSGNISGSGSKIGGLLGGNTAGTGAITNSFSNTNVIGGGSQIGGLVGLSFANISDSYSTGNVYSTGSGQSQIGGLVGLSNQVGGGPGSITDSYSTANVYGGTSNNVGGLVGFNNNADPIIRSYSTGKVTSTGFDVGGLVGFNNEATIEDSFWDTTTSGTTNPGSYVLINTSGYNNFVNTVSGLTTPSLLAQNTYSNAGWSFGSSPGSGTWFSIDGLTRPMLQSEYSTAIHTPHQLELMTMDPTASYQLANNIDLTSAMNNPADIWASDAAINSGTGFIPVGKSGTPFTGTLNGEGNIINDLYINQTANDTGLFGDVAYPATINNLGITNANVNYTGDSANIGVLAGSTINSGNNVPTIQNVYTTGSLNVTTSNITAIRAGGLVGQNEGDISDSYSGVDVNVIGNNSDPFSNLYITEGGLVGSNFYPGSITSSYSYGSVTNLAEGFPFLDYVGGLAGENQNTISNSYSLSNVIAKNATSNNIPVVAAGFVGSNDNGNFIGNGSISNSYSTGLVSITNANGTTATNEAAGFVGDNSSTAVSAIADSFWDTDTSNQSTGVNGNAGVSNLQGGCFTGSCTNGGLANLSSFGTYSSAPFNWVISDMPSTTATPPASTWFIFDGSTRPLLMSEYSTIIHNAHQLQLAGSTLGGNYTLAENIDLSSIKNPADIWGTSNSSGTGFVPIGSLSTSPFTGTFNGKGYQIANIYIMQSPSSLYVGLFGATDSPAVLSNFGLTGSIFGGDYVALDGFNNGTIQNVYNLASIGGGSLLTGGQYVGGIAGWNSGSISYSYNAGRISGSGSSVGGLAGINYGGTIANTYNTGDVFGPGATLVGGLVGDNVNNGGGSISNSYSSGTVAGSLDVGGFVGGNSASINDSFWDTDSSGQSSGIGTGTSAPTLVGGCLSGSCVNGGSVNLSTQSTYPATWIMGTDPTTNSWLIFDSQTRPMLAMEYNTNIMTPHALQLMDINPAALDKSYTLETNIDLSGITNAADVWGGAANTAGGFIPISTFNGTLNGSNYAVSNLYINKSGGGNLALFGNTSDTSLISSIGVSGAITGDAPIAILAANNSGVITDANTSGTVTGDAVSNVVGGFVANNNIGGMIMNSYNSADVSGLYNVGGLVSENAGIISDSFNQGTISGNSASSNGTGGLVNSNQGYIFKSYNTGTVTTPGVIAGGIAATNSSGGFIQDTYNTGSINGIQAGGLIGNNFGGTVTDSYSTGVITGSSQVGGVIGDNWVGGNASNLFWDTATSGQASGIGVINVGGPSTQTNIIGGCFDATSCAGGGSVDLTSAGTFIPYGWNFSTVWNIIPGKSYPYLRDFYPTAPRVISITTPAAANTNVNLVDNGNIVDTTTTGANGFAYLFEGLNVVSGVNHTIGDGGNLLAYLSGSATKGNVVAVAPTGGSSLSGATGLAITANNVAADQADSSVALSNSVFNSAVGTLVDPDILFSVDSSGNLTINSGYDFMTTTPTAYSIDGDITAVNGNLVFNGPTVLTGTRTLTGNTVTINDGISGNQDLNLAGNSLAINGLLSLNNVSVTGNGSGNSFLLNTGNPQTWIVTSTDAGDLTGITGVSGNFTFSNIQNLTGSSADDTFTFNDGQTISGIIDGGPGGINTLDLSPYTTSVNTTLTGSSINGFSGTTSGSPNPTGGFTNITQINGGSGVNTLNGENVVTSWNITGANSGTLNDGTFTLGFNHFAKLLGGSSNNNFTLNNGGAISNIIGGSGVNTLTGTSTGNTFIMTGINSGTVNGIPFSNIQNINGGSNAISNTLDFTGYSSPVNVTLTANKYSGSAFSGNVTIVTYSNINHLLGNNGKLTPDHSLFGLIHLTGQFSGFISDPLDWSGFSVNVPTSLISPNVSPIIQQPQNPDTITPADETSTWLDSNRTVDQNLNDIESQAKSLYDTNLAKVKINPYCSQ